MENHRKNSSSGEIFSFPSTPNQAQDSDFEFGCLTPDSPSSDPFNTSPADHLFFNGKLLPHSFPIHQPAAIVADLSRATSRTSSISSKDSLMSSRSNSTNSRSSSCSSARTSSSDNSERRLLYYNKAASCKAPMTSKLVTNQLYGSSQRWQYITPVPVLKRDGSSRRRTGGVVKDVLRAKKGEEERKKAKSSGPLSRFFKSFLLACRECHAMEPSTTDHDRHNGLQVNVKLK